MISTTTLRGALRRIRYSGRAFWSVAMLEASTAEHSGELVCIVGSLVGVKEGDALELHGEWVHDKTYGEQFKFGRCDIIAPESAAGLVAWLHGICPDVGRSRALAIVERFGADQVLSVIEREPLKLTAVKGVTAARAQAIRDAVLARRGEAAAMTFLKRFGLTSWQCARVVEQYGLGSCESTLRDNPYRLIEIDGFGFVTVDSIAQRLGVPKDHIERARAAVLHQLAVAVQHGHVYVPLASLQRRCAEDQELAWGLVERAVSGLAEEGKVHVEGNNGERRVYAVALWSAERRVAERVRELWASEVQS